MIGDLAKMFNKTKFFGYFMSDLVKILMDISEFGLTPLDQTQVGPRFYMTYLKQVWFLLFIPGTKEGIMGYSEDVIKDTNDDVVYDEAYFEKFAADATAIAKAFDIILEKEVSQGKAKMVKVTKKLGGWTAYTLQSSLEAVQYNEAIMKLPMSHPAFQALMDGFSRSLRSR